MPDNAKPAMPIATIAANQSFREFGSVVLTSVRYMRTRAILLFGADSYQNLALGRAVEEIERVLAVSE